MCKARVKELEEELLELQEYKQRKEKRENAKLVLRKNVRAWLLRRRFKRLVNSFHAYNRKDCSKLITRIQVNRWCA